MIYVNAPSPVIVFNEVSGDQILQKTVEETT
jgi:hypothetical protein